jgi:polyphosphate glucokinase
MDILGIDIGGSSIKAAPVNPVNGTLVKERVHIPTQQPATPEAVGNIIARLIEDLNWTGPIGCGFPAVIRNGIVCTAANIDPSWVGMNLLELFSTKDLNKVTVLNDADAAGLAEMYYGAGRNACGTTIVVTAGTGLGTALFRDNTLIPNTELGHIQLHGSSAEAFASAAVKTRLNLSYPEWAKRLDDYLHCLEDLFWPDLFVLGGEISNDHALFLPELTIKTAIVPATLRNDAGIIGAAAAVVQ